MEQETIVIQTIQKAGKPLKAGEISEVSGLDKKVVEKALKSLVASGQVFSPQRCFYQVKKEGKND